ncbi:methyltransferase domain-containing protein [Streptomyces sp. NPDC099050]|uniref:methyltransferase domain-containing protein n=1 Tax=Streptomyces sp. NPDC099050 TaxID=3366100 RepID=UPI0037F6A216
MPQVSEIHDAARLKSFERSLLRSHLSLTREDRPREFTLAGRNWDLFDEVFAPVYSPSTGVALELLGLGHPQETPRSGAFLEVGCGTGVVAVMSALAGYDRVVAADISPSAVENAHVNADRHGVTDRLRAVHSDLFSGLGEDERFDVIFWSSNYVMGPESYEYKSVHERAYVDTGYQTHRRFLEQSVHWTTPGGSVLLHFSDRGDLAALHEIAADCGRELRLVAGQRVREGEYGEDMVEHMLLEIVPFGV